MIDYRALADGPTFHEAVAPLPDIPAGAAPAVGVRRLNGARMTTLDALYDEMAAALQFPEWFGRNLDAFDECLRDVAVPEASGGAVVLVVTDPPEMLSAAPVRRAWFLEAVMDANTVRIERGAGRIVVVFAERKSTGTPDHWWRKAVADEGETLARDV